MITRRLFYFGPELTFSHEAAGRVRQQQMAWRDAALVPCSSPQAVFEAAVAEPNSGAVVPVYNHINGPVIDFMRFFLLNQIDELELTPVYGLFSRQEDLGDIERIYTKDTVLPQVDGWLQTLPSRIELIAPVDLSTAEAAARAAIDPAGAAICAEAAARVHDLSLITSIQAARPGNFTRFGLFARPADWWARPEDGLETFEHSVCFDDQLWERVRRGQESFYWPVTLHDDSHLHLNHLSRLLTLRKLAGWGNRTVILLNRGPVDDHKLFNYWNGLLAVMSNRPVEVKEDESPRADWIRVDSIEVVREVKAAGRPALLLDPIPGVDGFARMSARRGNTISWPIRAEERDAFPYIEQILKTFFTGERLREAGFDWQWGAY